MSGVESARPKPETLYATGRRKGGTVSDKDRPCDWSLIVSARLVDFSLVPPQTDAHRVMNSVSLKAAKVPADIATLVARNDNGLFARSYSVELIAREDHIRSLIVDALKGK